MAKTFLSYELEKFRKQFRYWYAHLSLIELSVNAELVRKIQKIETLIEEMTYEKSDY